MKLDRAHPCLTDRSALRSADFTGALMRQLFAKHPRITNQEIAHRSGVNRDRVSLWRGGFGMQLSAAVAIARAFDLDLNALKNEAPCGK